MVVDKLSKKVICTSFCNVKKHDFRLFKESRTMIHPKIKTIADTGYQGIGRLHQESALPKKKSKKRPLSKKEDKKNNRSLDLERVICENVMGMLKRFKILLERYRNRRKSYCYLIRHLRANSP